MEEKLLETIVTSFTKTLIEQGKLLFDDIYETSYDEIKQFIGKDLKNYLTKQKERYSFIKTLLRGNTPVYLYDVYFPSKLLSDNEEILNTNSSTELFRKMNYITIIGDAGSGKSTLVKHLFLNSIFEQNKIPILIELRYLNESSGELEIFIKNIITQNKLVVNSEILEKLLDKGKFTFFLDGFDEVDEKTKKRLVKQINDFVNKYNVNYYLLTSRPYSNIENLPIFTNLKMKDLSLDNGEIRGFVYKQLGEEKEIAEKAIESIEQGESKYIHSFLKNPLLLSLYLLTFQNYAAIPDKKFIFYRRVINALFSEHDSRTKLGYVREKLCGLDQEGFEMILKSFSFLSYFENEFSFNRDYINLKLKLIKEKKEISFDNNKFLNDLKSAISLLVDDEGMYSFAHRSLQEYFTALFITELKEEENERVYKKLTQKYARSKDGPVQEIENLLYLLKEMDEYNYTRHLYYPLLAELKTTISSGKHSNLYINYIDFFVSGVIEVTTKFTTDEKPLWRYRLILNDKIHNTIFVHLPYTIKLHEYLSKVLRSDLFLQEFETEFVLHKNTRNRRLIFTENQFDKFYNLLDVNILKSLTEELMAFIDRESEACKAFISKTDSTERDLVDLI